MVGGSDEAFEAVREPFGYFAELVVHAGPVGAGTRMKLARNLLHFVSFTAACEAARLAEAAGIDIRKLGKVVRHTDAITGGGGRSCSATRPLRSRTTTRGSRSCPTSATSGRRISRWRSIWATGSTSTCPSAPGPSPASAPGLGVGTGTVADRAHHKENA